jgi:SAM-dependent methyltransferase
MCYEVARCAGITDGSNVLDVGSGTGFLLRALADLRLAPEVVELDGDARMLEQAATVAYPGRRTLHQADLTQPLGSWGLSGCFDRLVTVNTLYLLPDPAAVLEQLFELAAPGAVLVVATPKPDPEPLAVLEAHLEWFQAGGGDPAAEENRILTDPDFQTILAEQPRLLTRPFPAEPELRQWFGSGWKVSATIGTTYAGQNWLIRARKDHGD